MKPSPANSQELYLGSLDAIGLDVHAHDIRSSRMIGKVQLWGRGGLAGRFGVTGWKSHNLRTFNR